MTGIGQAKTGWLDVANMLADAAFELDVDLRFSAFGGAAVFGHDAAGLLGVSPSSLITLFEGALADIMATVRDELVIWQGQTAVIDLDGIRRRCRLALAPKLDERGQVTGVHGLLVDLTAPELDGPALPAARAGAEGVLDAETGLWRVASFVEQAGRRFDRLDVENQPGTLLFLGFGDVKAHLQSAIAMCLADELREIVRPTDLLGRINRGTIGLWCDGMDHLTGAERAARLCRHLPASLPERTNISIGLATRWPGNADDPASVMERARLALQDAYTATAREAIGSWRVWQSSAAR